MTDEIEKLSGSGGGGGKRSKPPTVKPDTLRADDFIEFTLGVCEGPVAGLIDGPRGFLLDDTPLVSAGGDNNFTPFELHVYHGDVDASPIQSALGGTTSNFPVQVTLAQNVPLVRQTSPSLRGNIDQLEVRLLFNSLLRLTSKGDQLEETAEFQIEYRQVGTPTWIPFYEDDANAAVSLTTVTTKQTPHTQETISTNTVDLPIKGNLVDLDMRRRSGFSPVGEDWIGSDDRPGYDKVKRQENGDFYFNTSTGDYEYVIDEAEWEVLTAPYATSFAFVSAVTPDGQDSDLTIDVKLNPRKAITLKGKTTGGYPKEFVKGVPRIDTDWEIRVTKFSPDDSTEHVVNLTWESYQAVTATPRAYDNLAVARGLGRASDQFSGIPKFSGHWACKIIKVPSNYDVFTRHYDGAWNGTFKLAHTDNPAWCLYDLLTNELYGMRRHYPHLQVDRFSFYDAARWCDEFVPRPGGGYQPRYTYNDTIDQSRNAIELIYHIAAIFGAIPVTDLNGTVRLKVDKPELPAQIFGPESVTAEGFQYAFTDVTERINDVTVSFTNPGLNWEQDVRQVSDPDAIARNGRISEDMIAIGCNDIYEAQRRGFRRLLQANTETTTVTFQTARAGLGLELFDVLGITDPTMNWGLSGRVKSRSGNQILLRDPLYVPSDVDLKFEVQTPSGIHTLTVRSASAATKTLTIQTGTWPSDAPDRAQFALSSNKIGLVKPFRILKIEEDRQNPEQISITALEQNVNKYDDVDNMVASGTVDYSFARAEFPTAPVITTVESGSDHLFISGDGRITSRIYVAWEHSAKDFVEDFDVFYRRKDQDQFSRLRTTGREAYIDNVQDGKLYQIQVRAVNAIGRASPKSPLITHTVLGKKAPPGKVTSLTSRQVGADTLLEFEGVTDLDLSQYVVRIGSVGSNWEDSTEVGSTTTTRFVAKDTPFSPAVYHVRAIDTSGNYGESVSVQHNAPTPSPPSVIVMFEGGNYVLNILPTSGGDIPIKRHVVRYQGNLAHWGSASRYVGRVSWEGTRTFDVVAVSQAGVVSPVKNVAVTVIPPAPPVVEAYLEGGNYHLDWDPPEGTLPIQYYTIKDGTTQAYISHRRQSNSFSAAAMWGGERIFEVSATDVAGNVSGTFPVTLTVVPPTVGEFHSSVSRSVLKLVWKGEAGGLPIKQFVVRDDAGEVLARVTDETYTAPVDWNGSKTFWIEAVDTAGRVSPRVSVVETIAPPGTPELTGEIVDQNIHLNWTDASTELLVEHYRIEDQLEYSFRITEPIITTPAGSPDRAVYTVPEKITNQLEGHTLQVRVKAAKAGDTPSDTLGATYSVEGRGDSGPQQHVLTNTPQWYSFDFDAPVGAGAHHISLWTEGDQSVGVYAVEVIRLRRAFQIARGTSTTFPAKHLGKMRFFVTPIDDVGNEGGTAEVVLWVAPPRGFSFTAGVRDSLIEILWEEPEGTLPIAKYVLSRGGSYNTSAIIAEAGGTGYSFPADWGGTETFFIVAIDTAGNRSPLQSAEVVITPPSAPTPRAEVVDNNVMLRWQNGSGTLPVVSTEIRRGEDFQTAEVQQKVGATFATYFEFQSGVYKYWLVDIDSAGNYGTPRAISTVVNEPPDFVLQTAFTSDLSGAKNNVVAHDGKLYFGIQDQETFAEHFQNNGFDTPQQQIDAGYPLFLQPIDPFTPATYEEEVDVGGVLSASIITVTPTMQVLAGDGRVSLDIAYREKATDPWIEKTDVTQAYAQNFQFVRFRLTLVADSRHDVVEVSQIDVRLNLRIRNDAGSGVANAADTQGTPVSFNLDFVDVHAITVTPNTTTPVIPVYDFEDTQNPTGFTVYLFDTTGARVSGDFSWSARGY